MKIKINSYKKEGENITALVSFYDVVGEEEITYGEKTMQFDTSKSTAQVKAQMKTMGLEIKGEYDAKNTFLGTYHEKTI